jgi:hypothetical protein
MEKAVKGVEIGMCRWKSAQIRSWGDGGKDQVLGWRSRSSRGEDV